MMRVVGDDGKVVYQDCTDQRVLNFFEDNDVDGFFLEQVTDMTTFFNTFAEIILNKEGTEIVSLRHLEAVFSRYGSMAKGDKEITKHYYSDWENGQANKTPVMH